MSHRAQIDYFEKVKKLYPVFFNSGKVLEVGSLNINGTIRNLFDVEEYIGIDLEEGSCVDIVSSGQDFDYPNDYFDFSVSSECFEHNPYWKETFLNMCRMTKSGGLVSFSCASLGRPEHGTSKTRPEDSPFTVDAGWDYYKNLSEKDFENNIDLKDIFETYEFEYNPVDFDLYFYGLKK